VLPGVAWRSALRLALTGEPAAEGAVVVDREPSKRRVVVERRFDQQPFPVQVGGL
jgi:hypothetical protein